MLGGDTLEQVPQTMTLSLDKDALASLSHFKRAALMVTRQRMLHLEQLTRSLFAVVIELKGPGTASASAKAPRVAGSYIAARSGSPCECRPLPGDHYGWPGWP